MYGAIIGDIVGSRYEFRGLKKKAFPLLGYGTRYTDDTVMTIAVANALLEWKQEGKDLATATVKQMQTLGRKYIMAGYGRSFLQWINSSNPQPYNSFGNGSAMRVSPCGLIAGSLEEALDLAGITAEVTHNHPEGIKGAQAVAAAVYLAKSGSSREEIREYICRNFYRLEQTCDEIRPDYSFNVTCQGSVPQAIIAFLESTGYEDAVRTAVSLGGDADTQAAICGGIAWSYYKRRNGGKPTQDMEKILEQVIANLCLPEEFLETIAKFEDAL